VRVVLLHPYPYEPAHWGAQRGALEAAGHEVVAPRLYDFPGDSMEEWAAAAASLLGDRAVVVGASMGGYVALLLALDEPARVRGVGLVGAKASGDVPERKAAREDTLRSLAAGDTPPGFPATADELARATRALRDRRDLRAEVAGLPVPLLVAIGTEDEHVPVAEAEELVASVPDGQLEVFEGAGHILVEEDGARVTTLLLHFVARCT
jgi:pimeloyl-ACP methyl ester carboxylesterase